MKRVLAFALVGLSALFSIARAESEGERAILARYDEEDRLHPPPENAVLFIGSSTIERWGWKNAIEHDFPNVKVIDRGVSGTNYGFLNEHLDRLVFAYHPSKIVVYSGDNDTAEHITPEQISAHAATLFDRIHARMPNVPIVVVSIKPSPHLARAGLIEHARKANVRLLMLTFTRPWLTFVDVYDRMLAPDGSTRPELFVEGGLHMNEHGYAIWASALRPHLEH